MNIPYLTLLLLLTSPSQEAEELKTCVDDVCSTVISNQLAIATLQEDVSVLVTEMKGIMKEFNTTFVSKTTVEKTELNQCLERSARLEGEMQSLENKYEELNSNDQKQNEETENLRGEVEALRNAKIEWQGEKQRKDEEIRQLREDIKNFTRLQEIVRSRYRPMDCADVQLQGQTKSGVYTIYPFMNDSSVEVFCDLESDGGGWTVFLSRQPQKPPLDFNKSWANFKDGFGDANTEYWLGNDIIHALSSREVSSLRVDAEIFQGEKRWAQWHQFNVGDADNKYQVTIGSFNTTSSLGDSLSIINGTFFTTFDVDNDNALDYNCAIGSTSGSEFWGDGGWWYKACGNARPTAPIINTNDWDSCSWLYWNPSGTTHVSLKTLSIKLRRHNYMKVSSPCAVYFEEL